MNGVPKYSRNPKVRLEENLCKIKIGYLKDLRKIIGKHLKYRKILRADHSPLYLDNKLIGLGTFQDIEEKKSTLQTYSADLSDDPLINPKTIIAFSTTLYKRCIDVYRRDSINQSMSKLK